jgi:hypothetical protein
MTAAAETFLVGLRTLEAGQVLTLRHTRRLQRRAILLLRLSTNLRHNQSSLYFHDSIAQQVHEQVRSTRSRWQR